MKFTALCPFAAGMPRLFECGYCKQMFDRKAKLELHTFIHTKERPFQCKHPGCSCSFNRKHHLDSHQLLHSADSKPFKCEQCNKGFITSTTLKRHKLRLHPVMEEQNNHLKTDQMQCNLCDAILKKRSMKNHMKRIHNDSKYKLPSVPTKCVICGFQFERIQAYLSHVKSKSHSIYELPYEGSQ